MLGRGRCAQDHERRASSASASARVAWSRVAGRAQGERAARARPAPRPRRARRPSSRGADPAGVERVAGADGVHDGERPAPPRRAVCSPPWATSAPSAPSFTATVAPSAASAAAAAPTSPSARAGEPQRLLGVRQQRVRAGRAQSGRVDQRSAGSKFVSTETVAPAAWAARDELARRCAASAGYEEEPTRCGRGAGRAGRSRPRRRVATSRSAIAPVRCQDRAVAVAHEVHATGRSAAGSASSARGSTPRLSAAARRGQARRGRRRRPRAASAVGRPSRTSAAAAIAPDPPSASSARRRAAPRWPKRGDDVAAEQARSGLASPTTSTLGRRGHRSGSLEPRRQRTRVRGEPARRQTASIVSRSSDAAVLGSSMAAW